MAFVVYPFIVASKTEKENVVLLNHEKIHLKQQRELWVLPFFILYFGNSVWLMIRYFSLKKAHTMNIFEAEAFTYEKDQGYLKLRKLFAWKKKDLKIKSFIENEKKIKHNITDKISVFVLLLYAVLLVILFLMFLRK